jgi:flagellar FliL protein
MESHDAQLRDMAQSALSTKTLVDLEKPGARNLIRNELISGFNNILGDGTIEEIYFPEFAIQ